MESPPPPGIYVPVPTFFAPSIPTAHSSIPGVNLKLQSAHALHLARSGVKGLVLAGSTGEAVHLTRLERMTLIASTRKTLMDAGIPRDYPLIAGAASDSVEETVELLQDSADAGAQWGMVLVPNYFAGAGKGRNMQEGIVRWFKAVADASPVSILIYHYPAVSNNLTLTIPTFNVLARHPKIVGCKLSHGNVSLHTQLACSGLPNFHIFSGLGQQLFPIIAVGCHGAIDGLAGVYPKSLVRLFDLAWGFVYDEGTVSGEERKRRLEEVRKLQAVVSRGEEFVEEEGTVGLKGIRELERSL
ncbi:hypothetical protein BDZ91DRAFT_694253 [Kalaharituber pfeilii]|nr:hypothetical protein BDZ91DRAFT_694253 [Kalaharituber pfeilii]